MKKPKVNCDALSLEKVVRIGGLDFRLVFEDEIMQEGGKQMSGEIVYEIPGPTIRLCSAMSSDVQFLTLWHEILHGLIRSAGREQPDEEIVDSLANGIIQVLRDNPWTGRYHERAEACEPS